MPKNKTVYACAECGGTAARWFGRCPHCRAWNTLVEEKAVKKGGRSKSGTVARAVPLSEVRSEDSARLTTGIGELDRALGGGLVSGGVVLLGGDPGIGKSTLLMQALAGLARQGLVTVYVTGEESASQVALRAERLCEEAMDQVRVLATTELEDVENAFEDESPQAAVIDSIQTIKSSELDTAPGSVGQLREVTARLIDMAKKDHIALLLIGHVTKEGVIAGPKVLEHLVDTVLAFEGDKTHTFRTVRATKNRFGPTQEVGIFEMASGGLTEVPDPSALFLAERPTRAAGSVVAASAEGSRPLLVEVQALVAPALYGAARRVASGVDANRLAILLAVLERKVGLHVLDQDVFVSIAGGARVDERALDLAVAVAVASSFRDKPVDPQLCVFGEVGLAGEARAVPRPGQRLKEARKMGFVRVVMPKGNADRLDPKEWDGLEVSAVTSLAEAVEAAG